MKIFRPIYKIILACKTWSTLFLKEMNESKKGNYKLRNWSFELKFKQIKTKKKSLIFHFQTIFFLYTTFKKERKKKEKKRRRRTKNHDHHTHTYLSYYYKENHSVQQLLWLGFKLRIMPSWHAIISQAFL